MNDDDNADDNAAELPSLSSVSTALPEIAPGPPSPPIGAPATFHGFCRLPAELRIKIWELTFVPRVVELRSTGPNHALHRRQHRTTLVNQFYGNKVIPAYGNRAWGNDGAEWQSGCTNPAAMSVCSESRQLALQRWCIALPLARMSLATPAPAPTTTTRRAEQGLSRGQNGNANEEVSRNACVTLVAPSYWRSGGGGGGKGGRMERRTLHIAPDHDTVAILDLRSDLVFLQRLMDTCREEDPRGVGLRRLGLSVREWSGDSSGCILWALGRSLLKSVDQLILFMYGAPQPPDPFLSRGTAATKAWLEEYQKTGNLCDLIPCESSSSSWHAYKSWSATTGKQFLDAAGKNMKIGCAENDIKVMDLVFRDGW